MRTGASRMANAHDLSPACRMAMRPWWASAESSCPAANGSVWRWPRVSVGCADLDLSQAVRAAGGVVDAGRERVTSCQRAGQGDSEVIDCRRAAELVLPASNEGDVFNAFPGDRGV